jgi:Domain of Unknown Function (DUF1080)
VIEKGMIMSNKVASRSKLTKISRRTCGIGLILAIAAAPGSFHSTAAKAKAKTVWIFESDEPGKIAKGFKAEVGTWEVARDGQNRVLEQKAKNDDDTFNLVLVDDTNVKNLDLSVRMKAVAGKLDQGGGLVWRARDKGNYYIARYNPLEDNFRVYKVEGGKRTQFQSAKIPGDTNWHTLRVTMTGTQITCYFDGTKYLEAEDATFAESGKIGLWSKADARSYFDDLTVEE